VIHKPIIFQGYLRRIFKYELMYTLKSDNNLGTNVAPNLYVMNFLNIPVLKSIFRILTFRCKTCASKKMLCVLIIKNFVLPYDYRSKQSC
jgi:hypothetical protein